MRTANINRNTNETSINLALKLDGTGNAKIDTSIPFFDHMLELFVHHSLIDMNLVTEGDTNVDLHNSVDYTSYAIALATISLDANSPLLS